MVIRQIFISPGHNYFGHVGREPDNHPLQEVESIECVAGRGIRGDRFFDYRDNYKGQITFFAQEVFERLCEAFPHVKRSPGALRRNVIVSDSDLNGLIGQAFELQGVQFRGAAHCRPCFWLETAFAPGTETWLKGNGGLRAQILTSGSLKTGVADLVLAHVNSRFSAVLLAGGKSSRMGREKAFVEIDRVPLWRRQLALLEQLAPAELMIAGPPHREWIDTGCAIVADVRDGAGPLAGIVASLRACRTPLLIALAVDLPNMTSDYLRHLVDECSETKGTFPWDGDRFEPVAAVYPKRALSLAESFLENDRWSLQHFARQCVAETLVETVEIAENEKPLFFNMNTPADLAAAEIDHAGL